MNNRKQETDTKPSKDACSLALAPAEEGPHPPALQGSRRKEITDTKTSKDACSLALASAEEVPHPPALQGSRRTRRKVRATADEEEDTFLDASSDEDMRPGAVAVAVAFPGATGPSALGEPPGPSARSEPSLIIAELAEAFQGDEELRQRK
jgi:hypothetical protein